MPEKVIAHLSRRTSLRLEPLEGREVPTVAFHVNSLADLSDSDLTDGEAWTGNMLPGGRKESTLRAAIEQVNAMGLTGGPYTIDFVPLFRTVGGDEGPPPVGPFELKLTRPLDDIRVSLFLDGVDKDVVAITRDTSVGGFHYFTIANAQAPPEIQVQFMNLTIRDAVAVGAHPGGAINNRANLTLTDVNLLDNTAAAGGAVYTSGNLVVQNCLFSGNTATGPGADGGAIYVTGSSRTTLTDSRVSYNTASGGQGGAISMNMDARVSLFDTDLVGNVAANGGAIYASVRGEIVPLHITGGEITDNQATSIGGGLYLSGANARVQDVLFYGNAAVRGGAIYSRTNTLNLIDCSFSENSATQLGPIVAYAGVLNATVWITISPGCVGITAADLISDPNP